MACSKLFSGNLPEVVNHIIYYLRNDKASLYSCILVNRFLCRLTIPILWEDPLSTKWNDEFHYHFIDIYLLFLNNDDKKIFKESQILQRINSFSFKPLFDYPSFIKTLNTYQLESHVVNWSSFIQKSKKSNSSSTFQYPDPYISLTIDNHHKNDSLTISHHEYINLNNKKNVIKPKEMINTLCSLLIKLFMKNDASLNNLNISIISNNNNFFIETYDIIMKNPKFLSSIENFTVSSRNIYSSSQFDSFLYSIPSIFPSIKNLNLDMKVNDIPLTKSLADVIQFQPHLSSLILSFTNSNISYLFENFKYCSKTLTSIKFIDCDFTSILSFKGLKYLTQLKCLHFINCLGFRLNIIQPLLDIPTPLKIKSLKIGGGNINVNSIQLLFQKIGTYLENLYLSVPIDDMREIIINSIIQYCDKLKFLHLSHINRKNVTQICKLLSHFKGHLKYLTLEYKFIGSFVIDTTTMFPNINTNQYAESQEGSLILLKELSKNLPDNLEYLDLYLSLEPNQLRIFLNNCKNFGLKKLLIRNNITENLPNILNVLKEFVKNCNLDYLAYGIEYSNARKKDHQKLENLSKEIQSFEKMKKMKKYEDLVMDISHFED
ncbi:hypothetical protein C1645_875899 [Glomus cerebriforme]|uniref:F-box domain-containing protein n=1 Tax=Glomus cerebriforme TaxID=658196 RepID=A0A397SX20_9GLOM|nr:hypothetical protein C1645_875899 [Glomus cerebriforme]